MTRKTGGYSLNSLGLKGKLRICFYLMSILPLLVCLYLVSRYIGFKIDILVSVSILVFIVIIGLFIIKEIFDRIVLVSTEAKLMAAGDLNRNIDSHYTDEVGDLGQAINQLTHRIRSNMNELKSYSEKTTEINLGIQKRIIVLSSLLQISALVSKGEKLDEILKVATEKARLLAYSDLAFLILRKEGPETFFVKMAQGENADSIFRIDLERETNLLNRVAHANKTLILDKHNAQSGELEALFNEKFKLRNAALLPVHLKDKAVAMLGIGNSKESFSYRQEDLDLLEIFAKQISIALENDLLARRLEKLEIKDALTGLYNESFIRSRLQEEIKRAIAYHRPCAFMLLNVDNFQTYHQNFGELAAESALKRIATILKESVSEIDRVGRTGDNEFSIIIPEKNKRQALNIAEEIRKKLEFIFSEEQDAKKRITASGSVSENPLDGLEAQELIARAKELLERAKKEGGNRISGSA